MDITSEQPSTPPRFDPFDPYDSGADATQIRRHYDDMLALGPVVHVDKHGGFDVINGFDEVRQAAAQPGVFSSADGSFLLPSGFPPIPPLDYDEPEHRRWVKIMQGPLALPAVRNLEPTIEKIVTRQIRQFAGRGSAELHADFAEPIPVQVIGQLVGLSLKASHDMREVAMNLFAAIGTEDFTARMAEFKAFTDAELDERRSNPRDDYLSRLARGELEEERIDDHDSAGILVALLVGGHHSTAAALTGLIHHVLSTSGLRHRLLRDPELLDKVVEESLRLTTPLQYFTRTATRDVNVASCPIRQGGRVMLNFAAANRDGRAFENPHTFQLDRIGCPCARCGPDNRPTGRAADFTRVQDHPCTTVVHASVATGTNRQQLITLQVNVSGT